MLWRGSLEPLGEIIGGGQVIGRPMSPSPCRGVECFSKVGIPVASLKNVTEGGGILGIFPSSLTEKIL
jgi:hypothetical protein